MLLISMNWQLKAITLFNVINLIGLVLFSSLIPPILFISSVDHLYIWWSLDMLIFTDIIASTPASVLIFPSTDLGYLLNERINYYLRFHFHCHLFSAKRIYSWFGFRFDFNAKNFLMIYLSCYSHCYCFVLRCLRWWKYAPYFLTCSTWSCSLEFGLRTATKNDWLVITNRNWKL